MFRRFAEFFGWVGNLFSLLGICATIGFISGGLAGGILMLHGVMAATPPTLTSAEIWQVGLLLWVFISLVLLFYLYVFCRYTFGSILLPVLLNCFVTSLLTTWIVNHFAHWAWAFFVGATIGILVGRLFCICCSNITVKPYGMHSKSPELRSGQ